MTLFTRDRTTSFSATGTPLCVLKLLMAVALSYFRNVDICASAIDAAISFICVQRSAGPWVIGSIAGFQDLRHVKYLAFWLSGVQLQCSENE